MASTRVIEIPGGVQGRKHGVTVTLRTLVSWEHDEPVVLIEAQGPPALLTLEVRRGERMVVTADPADVALRLLDRRVRTYLDRAGRCVRSLKVAEGRVTLVLRDILFARGGVDVVARIAHHLHSVEGEADEALAVAVGLSLAPYRGAPDAAPLAPRRRERRLAERRTADRLRVARSLARAMGPVARAGALALVALLLSLLVGA